MTEPQPLDPFDVPKLSDLDKEANWIDRPVRDGLILLREAQSEEKVLGSVGSAISTSNNSPESNNLILSALGRLPEDGEADYSARIDRHVGGDLGSTNPIIGIFSLLFVHLPHFFLLFLGRAPEGQRPQKTLCPSVCHSFSHKNC